MISLYGQALQVLAVVFVVSTVYVVTLYYWKHRRILSVANKLPNDVPSFPLLGHGYLIVYGVIGMTNRLYKIGKKVAARSIQSFVFWIGPYPIFMLYEPDDVQAVLTSEKAIDLGPEVGFVRFGMGNGLVTAPAHIWKITRRHVQPLFNPRSLELLIPVLNQCARELSLDLSKHVGQGQVDVLDHVFSTALKASAYLVFGPEVKINIHSESFRNAMTSLPSITELIAVRLMKIWLWSEFVFKLLYRNQLKKIDADIKQFLEEPIKVTNEIWRKQSKKTATRNEDNIHNSNGEKDERVQITLPEVYRIMRQSYPDFTDQDLQYEIVTMLLTGSGTTKATVSSCLLALAANPNIQERLHKEIDSVLESQDCDVSLEHLRSLPYLDQVLRETMRKFMVVPVVTRTLKDDFKLSFCNVPAGATVCVSMFGVHFDPRHYPDPERFDPDRFSPENVALRAKHTYLAFGSGQRNCIGKTFAMMMMKILVIHVVRRYWLSTTADIDNITYKQSFSLLSVDGYKIEFRNR